MEVPDPLGPLYQRLEALADVYDEACAAIAAGESALARELIQRTKPLHVAVRESNDALRAAPTADLRPESVARARTASGRVQAGNRAVQSWLDAAPVDTDEAIRRKLPVGWDFAVDVLLLGGGGFGAVARQLLALGQRRLIVLLPADSMGDELPAEVMTLRTVPELTQAIAKLRGRAPQRCEFWQAPDPTVSSELRAEVGRAFREALVGLAVRKNTITTMGERWVLQGAANLPDVASRPSIEALRTTFRGKPCVIVSPGPSLDKNIHLLPAIRDRVVLMTSSHALSALTRAGVCPDVCVALDPQDMGYHFKDAPVERITLILCATVSTDLYALPAKNIVTFAGNNALEDWIYECLGENVRLPSGGSVACSELALATEWGCDPIIVMGQDLAFSNDRYYSSLSDDGGLKVAVTGDGTRYSMTNLSDGLTKIVERQHRAGAVDELRTVRGYFGGTVKTSTAFEVYRRWMTDFVNADRSGVHFLNCTEGGAYIDGMEHLPLAMAIERDLWDPVPVDLDLERALGAVDMLPRKRKMLHRMKQMSGQLEDCNRLANECARIARQARRNPARLKNLAAPEQRLVKALKTVLFLSLLRQDEINRALERARVSTSLSQNLDASMELYDVVLSGCELLRPVLARGVARLSEEVERG